MVTLAVSLGAKLAVSAVPCCHSNGRLWPAMLMVFGYQFWAILQPQTDALEPNGWMSIA